IVAGVIVLAALVDFFLVPRVHDLALQRTPGPKVRRGDDTHSVLTLINGSPRVLRLEVRDAWTPRAGAVQTRSRHVLAAGERAPVRTELRPVRRGSLAADLETVRSRSPLALIARQQSIAVPADTLVLPPHVPRRDL